jgi:hypothetical protein
MWNLYFYTFCGETIGMFNLTLNDPPKKAFASVGSWYKNFAKSVSKWLIEKNLLVPFDV